MPKKVDPRLADCPRCEENISRTKKMGKFYELGKCSCGSDWYRMVMQGARGRWWAGLPGVAEAGKTEKLKKKRKKAS